MDSAIVIQLSLLLLGSLWLMTTPGCGHIVLTHPPARRFALDYLTNNNTDDPCGMPSGYSTQVTEVAAGSTILVQWKSTYRYLQANYTIDLLDGGGNIIPGGATMTQPRGSPPFQRTVRLIDSSYSQCALRLSYRHLEWSLPNGRQLVFRSCADIRIVQKRSYVERCSGNGDYLSGTQTCDCNRLYSGDLCQNKDDCLVDADCSNDGRCRNTGSSHYPQKVCFCQPGWFGMHCERESALKNKNINYDDYSKVELSPDFKLYQKLITDEVEIILRARTKNWVALGWRPNNLTPECKSLSRINDLTNSRAKRDTALNSTSTSITESPPSTAKSPSSSDSFTASTPSTPTSTATATNPPTSTASTPSASESSTTITSTFATSTPRRSTSTTSAPSTSTQSPQSPSTSETSPQRTSSPDQLTSTASTPVPPTSTTSTPVAATSTTSTPVPATSTASTPAATTSTTSTPVPPTSTPVPTTSTSVPSTSTTSTPVPATSTASTPAPTTSTTSTPVPPTSTPVPATSTTSTSVPSTSTTSTPVPATSTTSTSVPSTSTTSTPVPLTSTPVPSTSTTSAPVPSTSTTSTPDPATSTASTAVPPTSTTSTTLPQTSTTSTPVPATSTHVPATSTTPTPATATSTTSTPSATSSTTSTQSTTSSTTRASTSRSTQRTTIVPDTLSDGLHGMDCTDMVIGMAYGDLSRVGDYFSRDRSTPQMDEFFGGSQSLTGALGFEDGEYTVIIFRRKVTATEHTDHSFESDDQHVIWAIGQTVDDVNGFYKNDVLQYHGGDGQTGMRKMALGKTLDSTLDSDGLTTVTMILIAIACITVVVVVIICVVRSRESRLKTPKRLAFEMNRQAKGKRDSEFVERPISTARKSTDNLDRQSMSNSCASINDFQSSAFRDRRIPYEQQRAIPHNHQNSADNLRKSFDSRTGSMTHSMHTSDSRNSIQQSNGTNQEREWRQQQHRT